MSESFEIESWHPVVFIADLDEDGNCPRCRADYTECPCPGPTMDGWEYRFREGVMEGRREELRES